MSIRRFYDGIIQENRKSFSIIEKLWTQENLLELKNTPKTELCVYHFGLGTWIRNNLLYPKDSILHPLFVAKGINNEDDMSSIMIRLFHYNISKKFRSYHKRFL